MTNIAIQIRFDGTNFHGWQIQNNDVTIQGLIKEGLKNIIGQETDVTGVGRTDAGVHAYNYTANFKTDKTGIAADEWPRAINAHLPEGIVVFHSVEMDDNYDARRSALNRCYRYEIYNNRFPSPFHTKFCHHLNDKLDIHAMREAAWEFIGEHDFRAYCASDSSYTTFVREMLSLEVFREGDFIKIDLMANAFLRKMVRTICGTLVEVGRGKLTSADVSRILEEGERENTGTTLPAKGLTLLGAEYPQEYMKLLNVQPCPCRNTNSHYIEV